MKLLKSQPLWLLWKKQNRDGRVAKVPFAANGGSSGTNEAFSKTWVTYQEAEQAAAKRNADGVGFKIPNGVFFLDIDHKDLNDPMVKELLERFNSYAEYSVSGDGIHVYGLCDFFKLPTQEDKNGSVKLSKDYYIHHPSNGLELYVGELTNRFAVYTGNMILDLPLQDCTAAVIDTLNRYMRKPEKIKPSKEDKRIEKVIQDLRNQSNGDKFSRLFDKGEMEVKIYQINPDRDREGFDDQYQFKHYDYVEKYGLEAYRYDRVWSGHLEADDLGEVFMMLNTHPAPDGYMGKGMRVSDICEVVDENGESKFFYIDGYSSYVEVDFESSLAQEAKERELTVLACYPGKTAEVITIPNTLKAKQEFVGGFIEATYPSADPIAVIVNEEGKLNDLPLNRALYTDAGEMYDIAVGPMLVVGLTDDDFGSLRGEMLAKWAEKFKHPETFVQFGKQILAFKIPEQKPKEEQSQKHHKYR